MNGENRLVLAVSPSPRGFAFVIFYKPDCPIDWGIKEIRGADKNDRILEAMQKLIDEYRPSVLVMEDATHSRRGTRIRTLLARLEKLVVQNKATVRQLTKAEIRFAFRDEHVQTKLDIAKAVAARLPAFQPRLPGERKIWMSEDPRQSLFDAVALGVAYYEMKARLQ
jgi:hypothetical protein